MASQVLHLKLKELRRKIFAPIFLSLMTYEGGVGGGVDRCSSLLISIAREGGMYGERLNKR